MKSSVFIATSLDGYIARPDGALDWLPGDNVEPHGYDEFMATVDAHVIGRKRSIRHGPKSMFVNPKAIRAANLLIGEAMRRVPRGDARTPAYRNPVNADLVIN